MNHAHKYFYFFTQYSTDLWNSQEKWSAFFALELNHSSCCSATCTPRSKPFATVGLNWAIRCTYHADHSANGLTASWQNVLRVRMRLRQRQRRKRKEFVGGGGDALGDFASVLCAAIVHQSLLEAKPVRTEQCFLRDVRPLRWNAREEIQTQGREQWMDRHPRLPLRLPSPRFQARTTQRNHTIWIVTCPASEKKVK